MKHAVYLVEITVLVWMFTLVTLLGIDWFMDGNGFHPLVAFPIDVIIGHLMVMAANVYCGEQGHE